MQRVHYTPHLLTAPHYLQRRTFMVSLGIVRVPKPHLLDQVKSWYDKYQIVIVPVDTTYPIRQWKVEVINPVINNTPWAIDKDGTKHLGRDLHGKEPSFRNENRPAARFIYFHFIMALVQTGDLARIIIYRNLVFLWVNLCTFSPFPPSRLPLFPSTLFPTPTVTSSDWETSRYRVYWQSHFTLHHRS